MTATDTLYAIYVVQLTIVIVTGILAIPFFYFLGFGHVLFFSTLAGLLKIVPVLGPSILQPRALDETTRRFAVIIGYDDIEEKILYHAGGREPVAASYADFSAAWRTTFNWMLTVCPPEKITWTPDPAELAGRGQFNEVNGRIEEAVSDYEAAIAAGMPSHYGLKKQVVAVKGCRTVKKADMVHNHYMPVMEIDAQTYQVRADGLLLTCEPAVSLPLAQRYFLF